MRYGPDFSGIVQSNVVSAREREKEAYFFSHSVKFKIWKENEVAGFVVFSQKLLFGYFRLDKC